MARHSKWAKIKRAKAVTDSKRGKTFTKHAKLVEVAARSGGDATMNPTLRAAIDEARADNMPNENIERAIKKGTGESKDGAVLEEVMYEGFGPGGAALYIEALTDNRNRTITNLKIIMGRHGGTMGAAGSVGYLFQKKGFIVVEHSPGDALSSSGDATLRSMEELELVAIDAGADDVEVHEDALEIFTPPQKLQQVLDHLKGAGIVPKTSRLLFIPQTEVTVDQTCIEQLMELIEYLEEDDDVKEVYHNAVWPV